MKSHLILKDGTCFTGKAFGDQAPCAGEVVFNTGMVGYPEIMTDPSYRGQIVVLTYPLIGNYGVPWNGTPLKGRHQRRDMDICFESNMIQISGLIVSDISHEYSHWEARSSLHKWMERNHIPGIYGIDTRALTKRLRSQGCMLGKIVGDGYDISFDDPNQRNLVAEVSHAKQEYHVGGGKHTVTVVDFGCKHNIIRSLLSRGVNVRCVPWDFDWTEAETDGIVLSNGPGDPKMCTKAIEIIRKGMQRNLPILGICLGHQLIALAAGGETFKLKYGHRSQNQPCVETSTHRCYITSQNHGYAVDTQHLGAKWRPWFVNANDGTNEGLRHQELPIVSVQFHPEAYPGPTDTSYVFDHFIEMIEHAKTLRKDSAVREWSTENW